MRDLLDDNTKAMFGLRLRALRQDKGILQVQAARLTHLSAKTLGTYERGNRVPSLATAFKLCLFYDAPLDFLFTGLGLNRMLTTKLGTFAQRHTPH